MKTAEASALLTFGIERDIDEKVVDRTTRMVLESAPKPFTILEVGAGTTHGTSLHYGAPWLARKLQFLFGDRVEVTTSDLTIADSTIDVDLEFQLFRVRHVCGVDYYHLKKSFPTKRFDLIYGRHLQPLPREEGRARAKLFRVEQSIAPVLKQNGQALLQFYDDITDESVYHEFQRTQFSLVSNISKEI